MNCLIVWINFIFVLINYISVKRKYKSDRRIRQLKLLLTPPIIASPVRYARVIAVEFPIGNPSLFIKFVI